MIDDWQLDDDDDESDRLPDPTLTQAQRARADQLSETDLQEIDTVIMSHVRADFPRKVAMVISLSMSSMIIFREKHPDLPDVFFGERVKQLANDGLLEVFGDLNRMRYSEIRLKSLEI